MARAQNNCSSLALPSYMYILYIYIYMYIYIYKYISPVAILAQEMTMHSKTAKIVALMALPNFSASLYIGVVNIIRCSIFSLYYFPYIIPYIFPMFYMFWCSIFSLYSFPIVHGTWHTALEFNPIYAEYRAFVDEPEFQPAAVPEGTPGQSLRWLAILSNHRLEPAGYIPWAVMCHAITDSQT